MTIDKIAPRAELLEAPNLPDHVPNNFFDAPFNFFEFNADLDFKRVKSAPGMGGIDYNILKRLPFRYRLLLLNIFNDMYRDRKYPDSWKNSFIQLIRKPGGLGFHLIALNSCLGKLSEILMKGRLEHYVEVHDIIPRGHHGFRRGQSCADILAACLSRLRRLFLTRAE